MALFTFLGGSRGPWRVERLETVTGEGLASVACLDIQAGSLSDGASVWMLRGATSNERYVTRDERNRLAAKQEGLGRADSVLAALVPIRKSRAWWDMTQDERRDVLENRSKHIATGLEYLPAIARRLYHCRDLDEPFDFLTWFEYPPEVSAAFEELVRRLRDTEEWRFVDREIDIRLSPLS